MSVIALIEALSHYGPDDRVAVLDEQGRELSFGLYGCTGSQSVVILDVMLEPNGDAKEA